MVAPHLATPHDFAASALRMRVTDRDAVRGTEPGTAERVSAPLDTVLTLELDGAAFALGVAADELLLAALGRTVARTMGDGVVAVDVVRDGRSAPALVDLICLGDRQLDATAMVLMAHQVLTESAAGRLGGSFGDGGVDADVLFNYVGTTPARTATPPLVGHALELRAYRDGGIMQVDWWFDSHRFDHATIQEFAEQFPFALIELTSEAAPSA
ncbi:hypothetical protein NIIDNTM18_30580 [Mycolicibacterium litorale]|uniref:Uncharacterized protein n=1 Tax=Mycolicibacterium litorale TaxID=758802 RepID=A0A6S6PAP3_9MYCO|nr:hypothetical protein [Mycolicibacterium litorale]BCI53780.1 hypothetical protein NIIDNTM18_30580 [Mycolicibacterium litorale]